MDEQDTDKLRDQIKIDELVKKDRRDFFVKEKLCWKIWCTSALLSIGLITAAVTSPQSPVSVTRNAEQLNSIGSTSITYQDGNQIKQEMQVDKYVMHNGELKEHDTLNKVVEKNTINYFTAWEKTGDTYTREKIVYQVNLPNTEEEIIKLIESTKTNNISDLANVLEELPNEHIVETSLTQPENMESDVQAIINGTNILDETTKMVSYYSFQTEINLLLIAVIALFLYNATTYMMLSLIEKTLKNRYENWSNHNHIYAEKSKFKQKYEEDYTYVKNRIKALKNIKK